LCLQDTKENFQICSEIYRNSINRGCRELVQQISLRFWAHTTCLIAKLSFYGLLVLEGRSTSNSSNTFSLIHTVPAPKLTEVNRKTPQDLLSFGSASHLAWSSHKPKIIYKLLPTLHSGLPRPSGKRDSNWSSAGKKRQTASNWINGSTLANFV